jgi:hypothetical protein
MTGSPIGYFLRGELFGKKFSPHPFQKLLKHFENVIDTAP